MSSKPVDLVTVLTEEKGLSKIKAQGFELTKQIEYEELGFCWTERRIIVHSPAYAQRQEIALVDNIKKALNALDSLLDSKQGKIQAKTEAELKTKVDKA